MKNLGKKTTLIETIMLILSSKRINAFEEALELEYGIPNGVGVDNEIQILPNILKVVIAPIIILIGLFVLIFGEKLKIKTKTRILIYAVLILIPIIITIIYSLL